MSKAEMLVVLKASLSAAYWVARMADLKGD